MDNGVTCVSASMVLMSSCGVKTADWENVDKYTCWALSERVVAIGSFIFTGYKDKLVKAVITCVYVW